MRPKSYIKYLIIIFFLYHNLSYAENLNDKFVIQNKVNLEKFDTFNIDGSVNAFIEIISGENLKWELNPNNKSIEVEFKNGKPRKIDYLSYPFNYGFIINTKLKYNHDGDGDPIDIIILSQDKVRKGSVVKVKIIGMIKMKDKKLIDNKIISVKVGSKFEKVKSIKDLRSDYPGILEIINTWFENYKGEKIKLEGIGKKKEAIKFIRKNQIF